jgi:hypothetical protein
MPSFVLADTTAVLAMNDLIPSSNLADFFDRVTPLIDSKRFGFPKSVVGDLAVSAREERITGWAQGLGASLNFCASDVEHRIWLMRKLQLKLGYEDGLYNVDGTEPSIVDVASYARQLEKSGGEFVVVSEDVQPGPLRPCMAQLCQSFDWKLCSADEFFEMFELSDLLVDGD